MNESAPESEPSFLEVVSGADHAAFRLELDSILDGYLELHDEDARRGYLVNKVGSYSRRYGMGSERIVVEKSLFDLIMQRKAFRLEHPEIYPGEAEKWKLPGED